MPHPQIDWECPHCGASNSDEDAECQYCDHDPDAIRTDHILDHRKHSK